MVDDTEDPCEIICNYLDSGSAGPRVIEALADNGFVIVASTQLTAALKRADDAEREARTFISSNGSLTTECLQLRADLTAAQATIATLKEESGWRPIESAPRDGTPLRVLYADGTEESGVYWQSEGRCCVLGARAGSYQPGFTSTDAGHLPVDNITHWRPLPAPPSVPTT